MKTLAIIGAKDLGQLIAYHAITDNHFDSVVFFDDFLEKNSLVDGHKIIGKISEIEDCFNQKKFDSIIIAIGYNHLNFKKKLFAELDSKNIPFATIIHSSSYVDKSCKIGKGVFILPGCTLDRNVTIGNNTVLNTACAIAHDTEIESTCFLSPRVAIAGFTKINELCVIGINATIIDNITICSKSQIGGGSVVTKSIDDAGLYVGIPAKKIKNLDL